MSQPDLPTKCHLCSDHAVAVFYFSRGCACDPATVDPRFLVDEAKLDSIAKVIERHWPAEVHCDDLQDPALVQAVETARLRLLETLALGALA